MWLKISSLIFTNQSLLAHISALKFCLIFNLLCMGTQQYCQLSDVLSLKVKFTLFVDTPNISNPLLWLRCFLLEKHAGLNVVCLKLGRYKNIFRLGNNKWMQRNWFVTCQRQKNP